MTELTVFEKQDDSENAEFNPSPRSYLGPRPSLMQRKPERRNICGDTQTLGLHYILFIFELAAKAGPQ